MTSFKRTCSDEKPFPDIIGVNKRVFRNDIPYPKKNSSNDDKQDKDLKTKTKKPSRQGNKRTDPARALINTSITPSFVQK